MTRNEIQELRDKRRRLVEEARSLHEKAKAEKRELLGDEQARWSAMLDEVEQIGKQVELAERQLKVEEELEKIEPRKVFSAPLQEQASERSYDSMFEDWLKRRISTREINASPEARALQADSDVAGGYTLAPQQFVNELIKNIDDQVFIRGLSRVIPVTTSDSLGAPALSADPEDGTWQSEIGTVDEDTQMAFGSRELKPSLYAKLLKVSMKLMNTSALPMASLVAERLSYKGAITEEKAFLTGTGAGQPLGVFTASADGIPTGRDVNTGNSTTAFTLDGLKECKYSIKGQYWPRLNWIMHRDAVKMAAKLKDGEGQYLWESSVRMGEPDRLLGFPVRMSENAPNTFTTGLYVGILGDFSNYWIADLNIVALQRLEELYAATNQVGFIMRRYVDGMPVISECFARVTLA